jgi:carboxyl-terminal processing protease
MNTERNLTKILLGLLLGLLIIFIAFWAGISLSNVLPPASTELPDEFDVLGEVWHHLSDNYVNSSNLDPEALSQGAIEGMLKALGDPYTSYIESHELELSDLEGSFEGIGALVSMEDGELTVVSPIANGPAERKGVMAGDKILEVDGEDTSDMSLQEAVMKIRGPEGSMVTLLILHAGDSEPVEINIVREVIELDSVYLDMLSGGIAHIAITHFAGDTTGELVTALEDAIGSEANAIVLDLRGNPGGYLHVVEDIADEFLDGGIVLYEADEEGNVIEEHKASPGGLAVDIPLVVLVDGGSASGSEVLAGALQDRGRAPIIGTQTFGKGSVNLLVGLSDGSAVYITTTRWLTPNMHLIEGEGIAPDIIVEITEDDIIEGKDPQLDAALNYLQTR